MPDEGERGNTAAPCVIDLRRAELRIPSYGIRLRLRASFARALAEESGLELRPEFALQLTARGKLRLIAKRALRANLGLPLYIITIDENSAYGFPVFVWRIARVVRRHCATAAGRGRRTTTAGAAVLRFCRASRTSRRRRSARR